jgi:hypothetical protein
MIIGYGLIALLVTVFVLPCCAGLKTHFRGMPAWLPAALIALVVLAFLLVPSDSRDAVRVFAAAH